MHLDLNLARNRLPRSKNCQNVPGAAGAAAGAVAAASAAASAVCIYYVIIGGALRAPLYVHDKIQQQQLQQQLQQLQQQLQQLQVHFGNLLQNGTPTPSPSTISPSGVFRTPQLATLQLPTLCPSPELGRRQTGL